MNKVILIGRLTKDPEVFDDVAKYTLAVDRTVKREGQPEADFPRCAAFGRSAEFVSKYLSKGVKIAVEGRLQTGHYEKEDGSTVYTTEIIVDRHEFCEPKRQDGNFEAPGQYSRPQFQEMTEDDGKLPF